MIYALNDLLVKMGAPDVTDKNRMEWHYCDKHTGALAGFAEIRMEAGGERLIAELKQIHDNFEDDDGVVHANYTEAFYFYAERAARPDHYRVTRIAFDGDDYSNPSKSITELALSVFHARALDISIRMIEQTFNKQDILEPQTASDPKSTHDRGFAHFVMPRNDHAPLKREGTLQPSFGKVIPFPTSRRMGMRM